MDSDQRSADVVIVGGGIAGLYSAWRLKDSGLSIVVLECGNRFGGRIYTHNAPGGFPVDMGAMRFIPSVHRILDSLVEKFKLPKVPFFQPSIDQPMQRRYFIRNRHFESKEELVKVYSDKSEEQFYVHQRNFAELMDPPVNSNWPEWKMKDGTRGDGITVRGAIAAAALKNPDLINSQLPWVCGMSTLSQESSFMNCIIGKTLCTLQNGMGSVVDALLDDLEEAANVRVCLSNEVQMISEDDAGTISLHVMNDGKTKLYQTNKLILACNARGIELISWNSPQPRSGELQKMFGKVFQHQSMKMFMTYKDGWWEKYGLIRGVVTTDQPIGTIVSVGKRAEVGGYATLLVSYTYANLDVFEGLNLSTNKRFQPTEGDIPEDIQPSEKLVWFVQKQLKLALGAKEAPEPVWAACRIWNDDPINGGNTLYKVGVQANDLQWAALKPFSDADIFISGDVFSVISKTGSFCGWMESSLITSERILVNFFGTSPIVEDLPLEDEWPQTL